MMISNYINHIALVVDKSGSMRRIANEVVRVFDREIDHLRTRSVELNQETRISVYLFDDNIECLVFDMDVMRMKSLSGYYQTGNTTALIDATLRAITDMEKLPELYGDHAFLVYAMTDGENNVNNHRSSVLQKKINSLKDNWTTVCMVPNATGVHEAKKFGFPAPNISIWSTTSEGVEQAGREFRSAMDSYMTGRSQGRRGTKDFFKVDMAGVKTSDIKKNLSELPTREYKIFDVRKDEPISDFVVRWTKRDYVKGSSYYELTKPEVIQSYKEISIQNRHNGKVYAGLNARKILGLPDYEIKVSPGDYGDWRIFVQSTSVNRKLIGGTLLLLRN